MDYSGCCCMRHRLLSVVVLLVFLFLLVPKLTHAELIKEGLIYAGNYTVFSVFPPGVAVVKLVSVTGDADLYASQHPSVADADSYEVSSCSCGEDSVRIPHDFARPVSVAVFGHPAAAETHYKLFVEFLEVKVEDGFLTYLSPSSSTEEAVLSSSSSGGGNPKSSSKTSSPDKDKQGGGLAETFGIFIAILFEFLRIVADVLL